MSRPMDVNEGVLGRGLPYRRFGAGPPMVILRGCTPVHANPTGIQRMAEMRLLAPLARRFRVYAVGRAPGLPPGTTMQDIADQHAHALTAESGGPVDLLGISPGGLVALQLAADHLDAVRRLVLASAGHGLGPAARHAQLRYAEAVASGRRGAHFLAPLKATSPIGVRLLTPVMLLLDPLTCPDDPADMVAFARAEDTFDIGERLADSTAPTLVIAGERTPSTHPRSSGGPQTGSATDAGSSVPARDTLAP